MKIKVTKNTQSFKPYTVSLNITVENKEEEMMLCQVKDLIKRGYSLEEIYDEYTKPSLNDGDPERLDKFIDLLFESL